MIFINDYNRFTWIYFLRSKATVFQKFVMLVETQFRIYIKTLRFDSGEEYMSHSFQAYLQHKRIIPNILVLIPLNKIESLSVRIVIS